MYGADKGELLVLRAGTGNNIVPTFYYSWKMPGSEQGVIGADWYEENIRACNPAIFNPGDDMVQEPGNMMGPTISGIEDLIAQDPTAYWDDDTDKVVSPHGRSPRIFPIPAVRSRWFHERQDDRTQRDIEDGQLDRVLRRKSQRQQGLRPDYADTGQ